MYLGELIKELERHPAEKIVAVGFGRPMSYRGYYDELAFEPAQHVTIGSMLEHAKSALGQEFEGYKGGTYMMGEWTEVWIAEYGSSLGDRIGYLLLNFMLNS